MIDQTRFTPTPTTVADAICAIMSRDLTARQKQVHMLISREGCSTSETALELGITAKEVRDDLRVIKTCLIGYEDYLEKLTPIVSLC